MLPAQKVELLRAACCVAGADGNCTPQETSLLQKLAADVGVGKASFDAMIARAESDEEFAAQQFKYINQDAKECMSALLEVAMVDGQIGNNELSILKTLGTNLNVPENIFDEIVVQTRQYLDDQNQ